MSLIKYPWLEKYTNHFNINKLAHSQLFSGKRGLGKLYFSREISKSLLCPNSEKLFHYCGDCSSCFSFDSGAHPDFKLIDLEEGSKVIKISQLRGGSKEHEGIINLSNETPLLSKLKIITINNSASMNHESQNFLLKLLEEPSRNTFIFLISNKPYSLKPTLLSRLNHVEFLYPTKKDILTWLKTSKIDLNNKELSLIEDENLTDINLELIKKAKEEREKFSIDLSQCGSAKKLEKIAAKWDDPFLQIKLNWLSNIIFYAIQMKMNKTDLGATYFTENISHLNKTKNLIELFNLSSELNNLIKDLSDGINLNIKIQIKALLSSY